MSESIIQYYQIQIDRSEAEISRFTRLANTYSFLRLFAILLGGLIIYQVLQYKSIWLVEIAVFGLMLAFAFLVKKQSDYEKRKVFYSALKAVNENEIASILKQENIYSDGRGYENDGHAYTSDLDIFGKASLFNLVNRCGSPYGNERLADWLSELAEEHEILRRQEAVKELASKLGWVQKEKALLLFARETKKKEVDDLIKYFDSASDSFPKLLRIYITVVPYAFLTLAVASWFWPVLSSALLLLSFINGFLVLKNVLKVNKTDMVLSKLRKTLSAYSAAFKQIETQPWESDLCISLKVQIDDQQSGNSFSRELKKLSVLAGRLGYRLNLLVGFLLNATVAWDVRQLIAIEDWKIDNRALMPKAFDTLSTFEALISLSSLSTNYQDWTSPEIATSDNYTYTATELAHPLIPLASRISNDFALENTLKIDIITGSNMAGKSTFLRTVGINAVLAFCGAPVCAKAMKVSVCHLFAYMRIRDSLNESISTFKAELNRLALLLEVLETHKKVYFLIDEMLRGTNSVDKYLGSKAIVEKLVSKKAVGIVATHDLQLARLEDNYPDYIRNFYFDIQVIEGEMLFDYKLKAGECKTFNASLLLKQIGIDVDA